MKIERVPRERVLAFAREQYRQHYGEAAPPKVRNAEALVALGEHRALRWRGHAYRVPPLPFRVGAQLLVIAHVLAAHEHSPARKDALRAARRILASVLEPQRRILGRRAIARASIADVRWLIDSLLHVPTDTPSTGPSSGTIDLMDGLLEFARAFPGLLNTEGLPVSWAHYQHGLRYLGRAIARDNLRAAQVHRVAQADKNGWRGWTASMRSAAGW